MLHIIFASSLVISIAFLSLIMIVLNLFYSSIPILFLTVFNLINKFLMEVFIFRFVSLLLQHVFISLIF